MLVKKLTLLLLFTSFLFPQKFFSQCFQIESILVDACSNNDQEGFNEMVRFKVGTTAINTSNLDVSWPSNDWEGLIQNNTTASKTTALNNDIIAAGGCGKLIEPTSGVLPANATVILVTSYNLETSSNSFGALMENIYIIYQNHNTNPNGGHFGNYNPSPGTRILEISFGSCKDVVSYDRTKLTDPSGVKIAADGAAVEFTPSGQASYINNGCSAPIKPFIVDAGITQIEACAGAIINLTGTAQGQSTVIWSAASGVFSNATSLSTSYTVSLTATGTIPVTLTATNSCGKEITDIINIKIKNGIPTFNPISAICFGQNLAALPTTSTNGITGTWSPALDNTKTTIYTFTPTAGQCASTTILTITVNASSATPTFNVVSGICFGQNLAALPTTSTNGITGTWSPVLDITKTTTYTFTPNAGQCASATTLAISVSPLATPDANFTYAVACKNATTNPLPIVGATFASGGVFSSSTITVNPNTGAIDLATATVGPHEIVYTLLLDLTKCSNGAVSKTNLTVANGFTPIVDFKYGAITYCSSETSQLPTTAPGFTTGGLFTATAGLVINGTTGEVNIGQSNSGNYTVTYTVAPNAATCNVGGSHSENINISKKAAITFEEGCNANDYNLTALIDNKTGTTYEWTTTNGKFVSGLTPETIILKMGGTYFVKVTTADGCSSTESISVNSVACSIQKGISPNNDGMNDFFDLESLNVKYLSIFNRYGTKVYDKSNYKNEWYGTTNDGKKLPDGTYYYVIEREGQESVTGWIYIINQN